MDIINTSPTFVSIFSAVFVKLQEMLNGETIHPEYSFCLSHPDKITPGLTISIVREVHPVDPALLPPEFHYTDTKAITLLRTILGDNWKHTNKAVLTYIDEGDIALLLNTFQAIAGKALTQYLEPGGLIIGFENCRVLFMRDNLQ